MAKEDLTYREKFIQMNKEARAVFAAALMLFAFFWLMIFLFYDDFETGMVLGLPLWFTLSCIGGYLLSVIAVVILIKFFFKNFSLHP